MQLTVSIIQMDVILGEPEANWSRAVLLVQEAKRRESQVVLLPELWLGGYALKKADEIASPAGGGYFSRLSVLARENEIFLIGSILERDGDSFYNTAPVFAPSGELVGLYRKIHLFAPMEEPRYLAPGSETPVFSFPWGKGAVAICYDLRFPELFRKYALAGAEVVFIPAQWPEARVEHWRVLLRSRAIENQFFIVACNRVGESQGEKFGGHSAIYDPWGEVIVEGGSQEVILTATIDTERVREVREKLPVLRDRRPELY